MQKLNLRRIRRMRDLTMQELAKRSGVSYATIANIEAGRTVNINAETAIALCDVLHCTLDELFCRKCLSR